MELYRWSEERSGDEVRGPEGMKSEEVQKVERLQFTI